MFRIQEGVERRFSVTVPAGMGTLLIVLAQPVIEVRLQLIQVAIKLLTEGRAVELFLHRAVEAFADAVGLRRLGLRPRMIDILHRQIELVLVCFAVAAVFGAGSVSTRSRGTSCCSKKGTTR